MIEERCKMGLHQMKDYTALFPWLRSGSLRLRDLRKFIPGRTS
jgi:hypothetical protein